MLNIRSVDHLKKLLGADHVEAVMKKGVENFVDELRLVGVDKPRDLIGVKGSLRIVQDRLLRNVLMKNLRPLSCSHGGITGRGPKSNALPHARSRSRFMYKADVSSFFPSIHYQRIYDLFISLQCSPDVAHICTTICTYEHHLSLGLVTSPFLADRLMRKVDQRIIALCKKAKLVYTRFVDDIAISGPFDLQKSGIPASVTKILREHGFKTNLQKDEFGRVEDIKITGINLRNGVPDVTSEYIAQLSRQLHAAHQLSLGNPMQPEFLSEQQLKGKVNFVCWVNPGRRSRLKKRLQGINWKQFNLNAERLGLVIRKKRIVKR